MTQNSIPALRAMSSLQEAASSSHQAVTAGHGMKVSHAKSSVSFTVLTSSAAQLVLQDNANQQRFTVARDALTGASLPKSGDTLILVNANERQLSFRVVSPMATDSVSKSAQQAATQSLSAQQAAAQQLAAQQGAKNHNSALPSAFNRALIDTWPNVNLSAINKAPLQIAAQLSMDANDPKVAALAKLLTQNALRLGQPLIELPISGKVLELQATNSAALVKLSFANTGLKDINIALPLPDALKNRIKVGMNINLLISPNRKNEAIVAVHFEQLSQTSANKQFSADNIRAINQANPRFNANIQHLSESLLFKASPLASTGKANGAHLFVQGINKPLLNALPQHFSSPLAAAIPSEQMGDARLLITSNTSASSTNALSRSSTGTLLLTAVAKPLMVQVLTQSLSKEIASRLIAGGSGAVGSGAVGSGAVGSSGAVGDRAVSSSGVASSGAVARGDLGGSGAGSARVAGASGADSSRAAGGSGVHTNGLPMGANHSINSRSANAHHNRELTQTTATTKGELLAQLQKMMPTDALAAISPKIQQALNHTLSHSEPSAPVMQNIKVSIEQIIASASKDTRALLQPILAQLRTIMGETSAASHNPPISSADAQPLLNPALLGEKTHAELELSELLRSTMSAQAVTQIVQSNLLQTAQSGTQNSFIEGLVSLLKLSLASKLATSPLAQNTGKTSESMNNIVAFASTMVKQSNPRAERSSVSRVMQDIALADPRGNLISEIGKLLSSHNTQKLRSAEASLQGQDTYYYALPNILNQMGDDIEIAIKREKNGENESQNDAMGSTWKLDIKLDVGKFGTVLAKTQFKTQVEQQSQKQGIDLHLYASSEALKTRVLKHLPLLHARLSALGIDVKSQQCDVGKVDGSLFKTNLNVMHTYA